MTITDHEFQRKEREAGRGPVGTHSDVNARLVAAAGMQKAARRVLDGSRLYFEAGSIFDSIGMLDKVRGRVRARGLGQYRARRIVCAM